MQQLPLGISDFRRLVEYKNPLTHDGYLYVDKTMLIREVIGDGTQVTLLTRPRRFGKTLNLSMLRYFFAEEVQGKTTKELFAGLDIAKYPECMVHQGKYQVLFMSFKDAKYRTFDLCYKYLAGVIAELYGEFSDLIEGHPISNADRKYFEQIVSREADLTILSISLLWLSKIITQITQKPCIILIDEYDTPIQEAYMHGYYDAIVELMRNFFSAGLKDNTYMQKAILTGILRVSKESLFSGMNNVVNYSILSENYANYFGFTEVETMALLSKGLSLHDITQAKSWYNGYNFGGVTIYNPWSIIEFLKAKGKLMSYWVNTSGNALIRDLIIQADLELKERLQVLMGGGIIQEIIDEHIVFGDLTQNTTAVWGLLLMTGYLTIECIQAQGRKYLCDLRIPNNEIADFYDSVVQEWLSGNRGFKWYQAFLSDLANGNAVAFEEKLQKLITEILSCHDVTKHSQEAFYHGLMLAFVSGLRDTHVVKSNKESGLGRYDVAIFPRDHKKLGIVMEFKAIDNDEQLQSAATAALSQIQNSKYVTELSSHNIKQICSMGIAFSGKNVKVVASS